MSIRENSFVCTWVIHSVFSIVHCPLNHAAIRQTLAAQQQVAQQIADLGLDPLSWLAAPLAAFADIQIGRVPEPPRPESVEPTDPVA